MPAADQLREEGLTLCRAKDFTAGEAKLREALDLAPTDPATLEALIKVRGVQKDLAGAKAIYLQAVEKDPTLTKPRHAYGLLAYNSAEYGEAKDCFRKLVEMNQKDAEAHFQLGNVYRKEESYGEARKHYNLAIDNSPRHGLAYNNLGLCFLAEDDVHNAIQNFRQAIDAEPANPRYQMNLGIALEKGERYGEATQVWEKVLTLDNLKPADMEEAIEHLSACKTR